MLQEVNSNNIKEMNNSSINFYNTKQNIFSLEPLRRIKNYSKYINYLKETLNCIINEKNTSKKQEKENILDLLIHLFVQINDSIPQLTDNKIHWFLIDVNKNKKEKTKYKILALSGKEKYDIQLFTRFIETCKIYDSRLGCKSYFSLSKYSKKINNKNLSLCFNDKNGYLYKITNNIIYEEKLEYPLELISYYLYENNHKLPLKNNIENSDFVWNQLEESKEINFNEANKQKFKKKIIFIPKKKIIKKNKLQQKINLEPNYNKIIEYLDKNYVINNNMAENNNYMVENNNNTNIFSLEPSERNWDIYKEYLKETLNCIINETNEVKKQEKENILDLLIHLFVQINDSIPQLTDNKIHWFLIDRKEKGFLVSKRRSYKILALSDYKKFDKILFENLINTCKIYDNNYGCFSITKRYFTLKKFEKKLEIRINKNINSSLCFNYFNGYLYKVSDNVMHRFLYGQGPDIIIEIYLFYKYENGYFKSLPEIINSTITQSKINFNKANNQKFKKRIIFFSNKNNIVLNNYLKNQKESQKYKQYDIEAQNFNKTIKYLDTISRMKKIITQPLYILGDIIIAIPFYLFVTRIINIRGGRSKNVIRKFSIIQLGNKKVKMGNTNIKSNQSPINAALNLLKDIQSSSTIKKSKISKIKFYIKENTVGSKNKIFGPYIGYLKKSIVKKEVKISTKKININ